MVKIPVGVAVLFVVALVVGCTESPEGEAEGTLTVRDSAGVRIVLNHAPAIDAPWHCWDEPLVTIGTVGGDPEYELFRVRGALLLRTGEIVVADAGSQELRFYDREGRHLRTAGGEGGGPGEFRTLYWIGRVGPDSIVSLDFRERRLSYFDAAGRFARSVRLEASPELSNPEPVGVFADGSLLVRQGSYTVRARPPTRVERPEEPIYRYRPDGMTVDVLGSFPGYEVTIAPSGSVRGEEVYGRSLRKFGRATVFAVSGDRFYVADNASYEIRLYSTDGELGMIVRRDHEPVPVTEADIRLLRDSILARTTDADRRRRVERGLDEEPAPPVIFPAYAPEIRVGADGNLWVREYTRPGERLAPWSVFSPEGVWKASARIPYGLRVLDVGEDYVLGLHRDDDGVEYLQLFELRRPS
ncbi:MAG: hypothetical protein PVG79_05750 [Gemmatimonadales bacterium]|jgi:hypothetical protein